jgi:hypothetical protein
MFLNIFCLVLAAIPIVSGFRLNLQPQIARTFRSSRNLPLQMTTTEGGGLSVDMKGKTVFVAGVADSTGYGWAIAKACAEAGASILIGSWPPVLQIFQNNINNGAFEEEMKFNNGKGSMKIGKVRFFFFDLFLSSLLSLYLSVCIFNMFLFVVRLSVLLFCPSSFSSNIL